EVAAPLRDHLAVLLRHQLAGRVRDHLHLDLGDEVAALARLHAAVLLRHQPAGGVRDHLHPLLVDVVAAAPRLHAAVVLGHDAAGGVRLLAHDRVGHHPADVVGDDVAVLPAHVVAALDGAVLLARHPDALAHPAAGALHRAADDGAGAVLRRAGARVE